MLLHYAGDGVQDIFDTLPDTGEAKDNKRAKDKLSEYFSPKINIALSLVPNGGDGGDVATQYVRKL